MSKAGKSPFKASLLQSPPKRLFSPAKIASTPKPVQQAVAQEIQTVVDSHDVRASSHYRASQSPQRSARVHKMSPEELADETKSTVDFDESVVDIRSPLKLDKFSSLFENVPEEGKEISTFICDVKEPSEVLEEAPLCTQSVEIDKTDEMTPAEPSEIVKVITTQPANILLRDQSPTNAASFLFRSARYRDDDESSEDELQSPVRMFHAQTPSTTIGRKPRLSNATQNPGFTPLAAQLSGWLASSPDKPLKKHQQQEGTFSPVAAQHVDGEVLIDRTPKVLGERRFTDSRQSAASRRSLAPGTSLGISMSGTPDKSSYFADEMAVKDFGDEIESMQAEGEDEVQLQDQGQDDVFGQTIAEDPTPAQPIEEVELVLVRQEDEREVEAVEQLVEEGAPIELEAITTEASREPATEHEQVADEIESSQQLPETGQDSTASSVYGDENADPTSPATIAQQDTPTITQGDDATPLPSTSRAPRSSFTTPQPSQPLIPRFANTVISKVPLRPEGYISTIKLPKKRSRSLSAGPTSVKKSPVLQHPGIPRSTTTGSLPQAELSAPVTPPSVAQSTTTTPGQQSFCAEDFGDSTLDGIEIDDDDENLPPVTPTLTGLRSISTPDTGKTPSKTTRAQTPDQNATPAASAGILNGAVVFVDVHTTEGADASGIFIELLSQMGARCVKSWGWNPRASIIPNIEDGVVTPGAACSKIGITHVVYKDGGKRTLEKVRDAEGVVKCVGVGWVLEYEPPPVLSLPLIPPHEIKLC
jgi:hypothetical protein